MAVRKGTGAKAPAKNASGSARRGRRKNSSGGEPKSANLRSGGSGKKADKSWAVLFWLGFAILIIGLFLFNRAAISSSLQTIQNEIAARKNPGAVLPAPPPASVEPVTPSDTKPPAPENSTPVPASPQTAPAQPAASSRQAPAVQPTQPVSPTPQAAPPAGRAPAQTPARSAPQNTQSSSGQVPQAGQSPQTGQSPRTESPTELRERTLYFTEVDRGGSILRVKVNRKLPVSDSPMTDVIQALIAGPSADEKRRGLISLIPPNTRILSATVRGNTAYISFTEDFQYNTYGVEGYAGQLRQIVFTVTEFPNIKDVQILIEGRPVDYLGEGIWIGSPISREML